MDTSQPFAEQLAALLETRRTIHVFDSGVPPQEQLMRAINLARWVPNHHHTEPWEFVLLGPESVQRVIDLNCDLVTQAKGPQAALAKRKRWSDVPGWLCVTCPVSEDRQRQQEDYAACCCAIHNLSLVLWEQDIGLKWTTGPVIRDPRFYEILGIPADSRFVVGLCWYGYPAQVPEQTRRAVEQIVRHCP